jgi:hypothetical protein
MHADEPPPLPEAGGDADRQQPTDSTTRKTDSTKGDGTESKGGEVTGGKGAAAGATAGSKRRVKRRVHLPVVDVASELQIR